MKQKEQAQGFKVNLVIIIAVAFKKQTSAFFAFVLKAEF